MADKLYAVEDNAYCPGCLAKGFRYRRNQREHFTLHVPRDRWPANMSETKPKRVVVNGLVLSPDDPRAQVASEFDGEQCPDCEFKAKSAFGLRAHARKHAAVSV